jgi:hypothetical protein
VELTPKERRLVRPYLAMRNTEGKGWVIGLAVGAALCAGMLALTLVAAWEEVRTFFLFGFVLGMVVIELALDQRRKKLMARVLQKYERAVGALPHGEEN